MLHPEQARHAAERVKEIAHSIDVLIHNAGAVTFYGSIEETPLQEFKKLDKQLQHRMK